MLGASALGTTKTAVACRLSQLSKRSRVREVLPPIGGQRVERNDFSTHVIGQLDFEQLKC